MNAALFLLVLQKIKTNANLDDKEKLMHSAWLFSQDLTLSELEKACSDVDFDIEVEKLQKEEKCIQKQS